MRRVACLVIAPLLFARPAAAHIVGSRLGDFYAGAIHPLLGLEDVILWLALGLLAGLQSPARARLLVPVFPAALLAGFVLGMLTAPRDPAVLDAALMVLLGALLATAARLPVWLLLILAGSLAVLRGVANAGGVGPETNIVLFGAGFVAIGYVAITVVAGATLAFRSNGQGWRVIGVRAAGSWIAAIGLMAGGFALRG